MGNCIIISRRSRLGNAQPSDVISGKTFSNSSNSGLTGTLSLTGTASASQVLSGQTFYSDSTIKQTGSMANNGAWGTTINAGNSVTIPAGYHNGSGTITAASVTSSLKTQTVSRVINMTSVQNGTWTFTFNQLSKVLGLTRVYRRYHGNTGAPYSSHQKFDYRYYVALDPIKISGNTISLTLSSLVDTNSTATWEVTAIGI